VASLAAAGSLQAECRGVYFTEKVYPEVGGCVGHTESVSPELLFIEAKWSSLASYGLTVEALKDFLPLNVSLAINTVRHDALKVAERLEAELGEERWSFIEGCPRDWAELPIPDGPITVGIDGGYIRDWEAKKRNFEVIVGKRTLAYKRDDEDESTPSSKRFGFVQTEDTKSKRRLHEVLTSQGFQLNQQITFLSDGEDAVRNLQLYMSPEAEHIMANLLVIGYRRFMVL
jgi:hypothetical protein